MNIWSDISFPQLAEADISDEITNIRKVKICSGEIPAIIIEQEFDKKYEFGSSQSWLCNKTMRMIVENGSSITYSLKENGNISYLKTYILGYGIAMLCLQQGRLAVHCSAVADNNGAILIAGESGAGKSTLTGEFLENGFRLMADDMAVVDTDERNNTIAYPAFPYQKLCGNTIREKYPDITELIYIDEYKDKFLVPYKPPFRFHSEKLTGLFILQIHNERDIVIEEIKGINKLYAILHNLFLRALLGERLYEQAIVQPALQVIADIPVYCVKRPKDCDTIRELSGKLITLVKHLPIK